MKKLLAIAFILSIGVLGNAKANCTRHIYNNSKAAWFVRFDFFRGSAFISNVSCATKENFGWYVVLPGCVAEINYMSNSPVIPIGTIGRIYFRGPAVASYSYYEGAVERCGRINHRGATKGMNLNEPTDGDITLFGSNID